MSKFADRYKTDRKAEEEGQWVDFGDGIEVKLRRLNSDAAQDVRRKLEKPYENMTKGGRSLPPSLMEEIMTRQLAQIIVVDWKGVDDENGKPVPCNEANVLKILTEFKDFRDDLITASLERATFAAEAKKEAEGNSKAA